MADQIADFKGLKCPMPIFKLGKELNSLESGQILEVLADDPAFKPDVEAFCKLRKHELVSVVEAGGVITATIKKS